MLWKVGQTVGTFLWSCFCIGRVGKRSNKPLVAFFLFFSIVREATVCKVKVAHLLSETLVLV